jgi:DNA-binding NarL/FixJ family response regulator
MSQTIQGRDAQFTRKLDNRPQMPTRHVLIVEDNITWQIEALKRLEALYKGDHFVQVSVCCGGQPAASFLSFQNAGCDLVILDYDMPHGDGVEFLKWFRMGYPSTATHPVITFSEHETNNTFLLHCGATHRGSKQMLVEGQLDGLITSLLRLGPTL